MESSSSSGALPVASGGAVNETEVDVDAYMQVLRERALIGTATVPASEARKERERRGAAVEQFDVTLITQCSEDRASFLLAIVDRWAGPVSAAMWVTSDDGEENVTQAMRAQLEGRERVVLVHFLRGEPGEPYPVNRLRNIALEAVTTSHFLVTDVDLWPSRTLYGLILNLPTSYLSSASYAMVVPAFEISSSVHKTLGVGSVPDSFDGLRVCSEMAICDVFKHATDTHTSTWYKRWWQQAEADGAYKVPCLDSIRYEPYLLVPKADQTPLFDERFVGYGKNKIQFVQHLRLLGFQFFVLPRGFVIHVPHTYSKSRHAWSSANRAKKNQLFMSFMREKMQGAVIRVPLCMRAFVEMSQDEYS